MGRESTSGLTLNALSEPTANEPRPALARVIRIVLEGIPRVRDGEKVEYEFRRPDQVVAKPRKKAE
jgi:hypothetical protein